MITSEPRSPKPDETRRIQGDLVSVRDAPIGLSCALPRERLPSFHIAFEGRDDAVEGTCPCLLLGLAFGERLRDCGKADKPPTILLPLQPISRPKRHDHSRFVHPLRSARSGPPPRLKHLSY